MELSKSILVFLTCLSVGVIYTRSASVYSSKPSDLEVGSLGPGDRLMFIITVDTEPIPGIEVSYIDSGVSSEHVTITYVTATEQGKYPDARSSILEGGPGFKYVTVRSVPGPSQGFNYTIDIYGWETPLPEGVARDGKLYEEFKKITYKE